MTTTPVLAVTDLVLSQAIPETRVNENVRRIEQGAQHFAVVDKDLATPPGSPADGDAYIVAGSPTGAWSGKAGNVAYYQTGTGWLFIAPRAGMFAWVSDEAKLYRYHSAAWAEYAGAAIGAISQGVHTIPVNAGAMTARTTSGAAAGTTESTTNKVMTRTLDFDQSTAEYAQIMIAMPKSWDEGTVTVQFGWTATATGNVVWGAQGVALSDDDAIDAAFGTAQTVTDGVTAAGDLMWSAFTGAITIAGTPAAEDLVCFQFYRDAANGSDTLAADARLIAVRIKYTVNAGDDS